MSGRHAASLSSAKLAAGVALDVTVSQVWPPAAPAPRPSTGACMPAKQGGKKAWAWVGKTELVGKPPCASDSVQTEVLLSRSRIKGSRRECALNSQQVSPRDRPQRNNLTNRTVLHSQV